MPARSPRNTSINLLLAALAGLLVIAGSLVSTASAAQAAVGLTLSVSNGKVGVVQTVSVSVSADAPEGQVEVFADGTNIASVPIGGSDGTSASLNWLPEAAGSVIVRAEYAPRETGTPEVATRTVTISPSSSPAPKPTPKPSSVSGPTTVRLEVPASFDVGQTVSIVVRITPAATGGTVTVSSGNGSSSGTKNVVNGTATVKWKPSKTGTYHLTATYSGSGKVRPGKGTATVRVTVRTNPDKITIVRAGDATPWAPESVTTLPNGADAALTATSASGAPVSLAVTGPCTLNGSVLHVNGVGGTCRLTASSPGGNGFTKATVAYAVATAAGSQTATVDPSADDVYAKGTTLKLAPLAALTNVGQPITWYVEKGPKICKVIKKGGWARVKLLKSGSCTVVGVSPAISDQWAEFRVIRTYTVR